jgi:hypothetical protein
MKTSRCASVSRTRKLYLIDDRCDIRDELLMLGGEECNARSTLFRRKRRVKVDTGKKRERNKKRAHADGD